MQCSDNGVVRNQTCRHEIAWCISGKQAEVIYSQRMSIDLVNKDALRGKQGRKKASDPISNLTS